MRAQRRRGDGDPPGLAARLLAAEVVHGVLGSARPLEQLIGAALARAQFAALAPRDRALARAVATTVLRRRGELEGVLAGTIARPLPAGSGYVTAILLCAVAQLLILAMPAHAVVDLAVELSRRMPGARPFANLVNAVLRRVAREGQSLLAAQEGVRSNIPDWLWRRWSAAYGAADARRIAEASLREAPLDINVGSVGNAERRAWAERLGGRLLPTGAIRLGAHGPVEELAGYTEGAWWVQDAAAQLIARLAGDVAGRSVADLCAAPGGKTAALAAAGARVTAVDLSPSRLERLRDNLRRLRLDADVVAADAATWSPGVVFDAVVLDAPCTGTGTIRRHPDILSLKRPGDVGRMARLQQGMLANAARLVGPSGVLVYSTCSLEREEGEQQTTAFLAAAPAFERVAIEPTAIGAASEWLTPLGELRTLPFHLQLEDGALSGIDGFYAVCLRRRA